MRVKIHTYVLNLLRIYENAYSNTSANLLKIVPFGNGTKCLCKYGNVYGDV